MSDHPKVAIFWDYENCNPPSNSCGLGYDIVNNIGRMARLFGSVTTFRAYLDISAQSPKSVALRSELQSSGVSMIDCPHNGRKDVVDKMILVDMLAFAVDHPGPATIILIAGDRDYAYAVSTLKLRKYQVILVVPSSPHTSPSLESQASLVIDWGAAALRTRTEAGNSTQAIRQPYFELNADLVTKLLRELQDLPPDDPDATMHPYIATSQSTLRLRRISTRDLLEPSRHYKNTGSFVSTQECTPTPASPRKSTSAGGDPAPGELPVPKTPSRSRCASVSSGSTRTRSTTIVAQSPPVVEQDTPTKNPPLSSARRSDASDITDVVDPAKRSPPILPSLDTLELSPHDSCPPSSIIVRSPELSQSIPVSRTPTITSSHKLNCLASPFVMTKALTGLESIPSFCTKQSHTTTRPTSPIVAATEPLPEVVTSACETPKIKDIGAPKKIWRPNRLRVDGNGTDSVRSIPHPTEGTRDGTDTPKSNYHSYVAPPTTCSPSSTNVDLHPADTPSYKHASPAATPPGIGDGVDSQFAVSSCASGSESVLSSSTSPSTPFTALESHERDESRWWTMFKPLIHLLLVALQGGIARPSRSTIAVALVQSDKEVYRRAGVSKFRDYSALAEQAGIVELGGIEGGAWIALHPDLLEVDGVTTTHPVSNRVWSPAPDSPNVIQNPFKLLTEPKTPVIEKTTIFQSPSFASPKFNSLAHSNTLPTSPIDRQGSASRTSIPAHFQPLIDVLIRLRAEGSHQPLRSVIGQLLGQDVYARAGASEFKAYVYQASEAQLVQFGGIGGYAWIGLHPELRI